MGYLSLPYERSAGLIWQARWVRANIWVEQSSTERVITAEGQLQTKRSDTHLIKLNDIVDTMYSSGLLKILYKAPDVATGRMLLDRVVRRSNVEA